MAIWSGSKLLSDIPRYGIVRPFRQRQIDCSAYTLTLGEEYYITPSASLRFEPHTKRYLEPTRILEDGAGAPVKDQYGDEFLIGGGSLSIPPGQFGFLLTEEFIKMPDHAMGFISLKSTPKFQGLINVSGFHVDPGFEGHLIFSVYNAGPAPITFDRGQHLFLLWIASLEGEDFSSYSRTGKPPLEDISAEVISRVPGEMTSLKSLSDRIDRMEPQAIIFKAVAYAVVTALALFFALLQLTNVKFDIALS